MTFALCVKTGDGIVIAADSTTSTVAVLNNTPTIMNLFRHANKVFNIVKPLPLGLCTAGMASFGAHAIEFLLKELRVRLTNPDNDDWYVDPGDYTVEEVAEKVHRFFFEEQYLPRQDEIGPDGRIMFYIAGIDTSSIDGVVYRVDIPAIPERPAVSMAVSKEQTAGFVMDGQIEPVHRLIKGYSVTMLDLLVQRFGLPEDQKEAAVSMLNSMEVAAVSPQMPIQDAIDLSEFLVDVAVKWTRFLPGMETVGGQIDIATITKHEGFKWVRRKHFFGDTLNPDR